MFQYNAFKISSDSRILYKLVLKIDLIFNVITFIMISIWHRYITNRTIGIWRHIPFSLPPQVMCMSWPISYICPTMHLMTGNRPSKYGIKHSFHASSFLKWYRSLNNRSAITFLAKGQLYHMFLYLNTVKTHGSNGNSLNVIIVDKFNQYNPAKEVITAAD